MRLNPDPSHPLNKALRSSTHARRVSPVPHTCTARPRAGPPDAIRKCALHRLSCVSEHRACVRVLCAGYCRHRYSGSSTLPATSPETNHRCQKSASTGHHPLGRRPFLPVNSYAGSASCAQSATTPSSTQRSRYGRTTSAGSYSAGSDTATSSSRPSLIATRSNALRRYRPEPRSAGISTNRPFRIELGVSCAFCQSIHRSIPGRRHPHSCTVLVAQSHRGLSMSDARSVAKAFGGRRSSDSISPTSSPRAAAYAAFKAFPCPLGPCALTSRTTSWLPGVTREPTCSTVSGVNLSDSQASSLETGKPPAPGGSSDDVDDGAAVALGSSAGFPSSPRVASAAARASSHSLDPSVDESSTAMSSKPPCVSRPTWDRTLATQSGSHGIAFLQGISTETHGVCVDGDGPSSPPTRTRFALGGSASPGIPSRP